MPTVLSRGPGPTGHLPARCSSLHNDHLEGQDGNEMIRVQLSAYSGRSVRIKPRLCRGQQWR